MHKTNLSTVSEAAVLQEVIREGQAEHIVCSIAGKSHAQIQTQQCSHYEGWSLGATQCLRSGRSAWVWYYACRQSKDVDASQKFRETEFKFRRKR